MDKKLQRMIHQLRSEKCPPRVLGKVQDKIAASGKNPGSVFRGIGLVMSSLGVVVIMTLFLWHPGAPLTTHTPQPTPAASLSNQQVAEETHLALALIGNALLKAGHKTGEKLFNEAVPPLRNGFETTKLKLTRSSE